MLTLITHAHAYSYGSVCVRVMLEKCKYLAKMRVIYICIVEMRAVMYSSFCSWPIFSSLPVRPTRRLIVVTIHHHHQPRPRPQPRPQSENKNANNATSVFVCLAHICTYTHTHKHIRTSPNCLSRCLWLYVISSSFIQFAFQAICIRVYACVRVCAWVWVRWTSTYSLSFMDAHVLPSSYLLSYSAAFLSIWQLIVPIYKQLTPYVIRNCVKKHNSTIYYVYSCWFPCLCFPKPFPIVATSCLALSFLRFSLRPLSLCPYASNAHTQKVCIS